MSRDIEALATPIRIALLLDSIFLEHQIDYFIGGSIAGSLIGEPRTTNDIDIIVHLPPERLGALIQVLSPQFYFNPDKWRESVIQKKSYNLIHFETIQKVDLFPLGTSAYDHAQMSRRKRVAVTQDPERSIWVASPEDLLLSKLRWYRQGGETSDRQWKDLLGIVKIQGDQLDRNYIEKWAKELRLEDLYQKLTDST